MSDNIGQVKSGERIFAVSARRKFENLVTIPGECVATNHIFKPHKGSFNPTTFTRYCDINVGDSGCPAFNMKGQLVGITSLCVEAQDIAWFVNSAQISKSLMTMMKAENVKVLSNEAKKAWLTENFLEVFNKYMAVGLLTLSELNQIAASSYYKSMLGDQEFQQECKNHFNEKWTAETTVGEAYSYICKYIPSAYSKKLKKLSSK